MQFCAVTTEALLLQATEVDPRYVRDVWHIGEDFELLDSGKASWCCGVARCCVNQRAQRHDSWGIGEGENLVRESVRCALAAEVRHGDEGFRPSCEACATHAWGKVDTSRHPHGEVRGDANEERVSSHVIIQRTRPLQENLHAFV
jgi:hypothetical protein